jgi:hypothetical protein
MLWRVLVFTIVFCAFSWCALLWSYCYFFFMDRVVEVAGELQGFHDLVKAFVVEDAAKAGGLECFVGDGDVDAVPPLDLVGDFFQAAVVECELVLCPERFHIAAILLLIVDFCKGHEGFVVGVALFGFDAGDGDLVVMYDKFFAGLEDDLFVGEVFYRYFDGALEETGFRILFVAIALDIEHGAEDADVDGGGV